MKGKNQHAWVEQGYQMISEQSFTHVNVESIAREMNKNKSSFYYYFGDWEGFEEALLAHHLDLAKEFAKEVSDCKSIIPDMVNLFIARKTDLFFHKQLRINREKPQYRKCFESVHDLFEKAVLKKWISFLKLESQPFLAAKILTLLSENFLLQITHEQYTFAWIQDYLGEASKLVMGIHSQAP